MLAALAAAAPAWAADAPAFKVNVAHTGYSPERLGTTLRRAWTRRLPGRLTYPVVAGRRVFVSAQTDIERQRVVALDARTGKVLWARRAKGAAPGLATTGRQLLWARGGRVGAFDQRTGRRLWSRTIIEEPFTCSDPTADAGVVYTGCSGQRGSGLHALAAADGRPLWSNRHPVEGAPALAGDRVVTMGDPCIEGAAHDRRTGALLWGSKSICERFGRTPVVYAGRAYIGDLFAGDYPDPVLDLVTGAEVGRLLTDHTPAFAAGRAFVVHAGELRVEDVASGAVRWRFRDREELVTSPLIVRRRVYVATADGRLTVLDRGSGRVLQRVATGVKLGRTLETVGKTGLSAGGDRLLVPGRGRLTAFR